MAAHYPHESERLDALRAYQILDTEPEKAYDDLARIAAFACGTESALISFLDADRAWFKARRNFEASSLAREEWFCTFAAHDDSEVFQVKDAEADSRFVRHPIIQGETGFKFYASAPLIAGGGFRLGALAVLDREPRELSEEQCEALQALARQVVAQLDLRMGLRRLREQKMRLIEYQQHLDAYQREIEAHNVRLQSDSLLDGLTGLGNRRALLDRLHEEIDRATRQGTPLSMLVADVDSFGDYNETFGHLAGDQVLREISALFAERTRSSDFAARCGDDAIAVVLPNADASGAFLLAERFRQVVEQANWPNRELTVSVGVASFRAGKDTPTTFLGRADEALYVARSCGPNHVADENGMPAVL